MANGLDKSDLNPIILISEDTDEGVVFNGFIRLFDAQNQRAFSSVGSLLLRGGDNDTNQPNVIVTNLSFMSSPIMFMLESSVDFSKHFKMGAVLKEYNFTLVVKSNMDVIKSVYKFFKLGGSDAIKKGNIAYIECGVYKMIGYCYGLRHMFSNKAINYQVFSLQFLGIDYE
jgi:hypothetical protein